MAWCGSRGRKESDMSERMNGLTDLIWIIVLIMNKINEEISRIVHFLLIFF